MTASYIDNIGPSGYRPKTGGAIDDIQPREGQYKHEPIERAIADERRGGIGGGNDPPMEWVGIEDDDVRD